MTSRATAVFMAGARIAQRRCQHCGVGAALVGPFLVAGLLFAALYIERAARGATLRKFRLLAVLAWAVAPALLAIFWFGLR
jgi:hypothetical protein